MATMIPHHPQYDLTLKDVVLVRDAVEGQPQVKRKQSLYLPHPNMVDTSSRSQQLRYSAYIGRAEFDSSCGQTKASLMGAVQRVAHEITLPTQVTYLETDSDGDWLDLEGSINVTIGEILEAKYHILLAEFESDAVVNPDAQISKADAKELNGRAKIVHYPREALTSWDYKKINGRLQLSFACLTTTVNEVNENFTHSNKVTQVLLSLDDNGEYRQKKIIKSGNEVSETDWIYPLAKDKRLNYLPVEIVTDERRYSGTLPKSVGYLGAIALKDISRYQVNADLKEKIAILQDTINSTGWTVQSWNDFTEINGRDYIALGAGSSNQFPQGVDVSVLKLAADGDACFKYIENNEKQTRALGGRYDTELQQADKTATEANIKSAQENAILTMIVANVETAYKRLVCYCAEFEGVKLLPENIDISLNRSFTDGKLSAQDAAEVRNQHMDGLRTKESTIAALQKGGWIDQSIDIQKELTAIEEETPPPVIPATGNSQISSAVNKVQ